MPKMGTDKRIWERKNVGKEKINVMNGPLPKRVSFLVAPMKQLIIRVKVLYIIFSGLVSYVTSWHGYPSVITITSYSRVSDEGITKDYYYYFCVKYILQI